MLQYDFNKVAKQLELEISSERQVLILKFLSDSLHVQPRDQKLVGGNFCDIHFGKRFLE